MQKTFCQDSAASDTMKLQKCKDKAGRLKERGSASAVAVVQFVSWGSVRLWVRRASVVDVVPLCGVRVLQ